MVILWAIIYFIAACLFMAMTNWVSLIPWRRAVNAHWTERARLLWPVRVTAGLSVFFLPVFLNEIQSVLYPTNGQNWLVNGFAAFLGAILGCYPFDREIFPKIDFKEWRHQVVAGWGVRFGIWALLIAGILFMPETVGLKMVAVVGIYLLLHLAIQWGLFLRYLRWVKFCKPAGERLQCLVAEISTKMGITPKAVWQSAGPHAMAFAFPTTRELLFSDRLLEICTDEEISAICCHEMAHLSESKVVLAGRLLGSLTVLPLIFILPCIHYFGGFGLLIPYGVMFLISRYARSLSQRMEKRADQMAADKQLHEGVYACALEKIYRENKIPAVNINNRQTHPHLYDRMIAAGITPDYPRPAKPQRFTWVGWLLLIVFGVFLGLSFAKG